MVRKPKTEEEIKEDPHKKSEAQRQTRKYIQEENMANFEKDK